MIGNRSGLSATFGCVLALVLVGSGGCGDDPQSVSLELLTPEPDQVLTLDDDGDEERSGLQFQVTGRARGIGAGTSVNLYIDGEQRTQSAEVDEDGAVDFGDVTLPAGEHEIHIETSTGSSSSDPEQQYTFKALLIRTPMDGARLTAADDEDQSKSELQISVGVEAFAIGSERVTLELDGKDVATLAPGASGVATFAGVTLAQGRHSLLARAGSGEDAIESPPITLDVTQEACASAEIVAPQALAGADGRVSIGGAGSCPQGSQPFTTDFRFSTDGDDGLPAQLLINGEPSGDATVSDGMIAFDAVQLPLGDTGSSVAVEFERGDGTRCTVDFPFEVVVDCDGPACAIKSPTPVEADGTLYLNAAMRSGSGFDVVVQTQGTLAGNDVQLVIDGRTDDALSAAAERDGSNAVAQFERVALGDGEHTIEALCTDGAGNVSSSGELTWVVDTTPCGVTVSDPVDGALFVPDDDEDGGSIGTQVVVTSAISGDDCVAQRTRVCDPAAGIPAGDFIAYGGSSPLLSSVRLDDAALDQSLCVQVIDRAGNYALDSVDVRYQRQAPVVQIESPLDGDSYNAAGAGSVLADANVATPVCEAAFSIACTAGVPVQLRAGGPSGAVIATADCVVPAAGDPALPSGGYDGRARLVAPFDDGDGTGTVFATQIVTGSSTKTLVGASGGVDLAGDCAPPAATFVGDPCNLANGGVLTVTNPGDVLDRDVVVRLSEASLTGLALTVQNGASTTLPSPDGSGVGDHVFASAPLGGVGAVTLRAAVNDAAGNAGGVECSAQISSTAPAFSVTLTAPTNLQAFGPRNTLVTATTCDTGTAGQYGVRVDATLTNSTNRTVDVLVNDVVAVSNVAISGGNTISTCVAVPDNAGHTPAGLSTITVRARNTVTNDMSQATAVVSVETLQITAPLQGAALGSADDCDAGPGRGAQVTVSADVTHNGKTVTLASGSASATPMIAAGSATACLAVAQGMQTITATIPGPITDSVMIVAAWVPTTGIVINPLVGPDPLSASYRDGVVTATWPKPTMDFSGQLVSYQLRCASSELLASADDPTKLNWWTTLSAPRALPGALTPDDDNPSAPLTLRVAETKHCLVRAFDANGEGTPITQTRDLTLKFRQRVLATGTGSDLFGQSTAAAGDVDGDGNDDLLVGGQGRAALIFGQDDPTQPAVKIDFVGASGGVGRAVAGIGDFNGDTRADIAVSNWVWSSNSGQVSVFYGRTRAQWLLTPTIDMDAGCSADLCIESPTAGAFVGRTLRGVGDFDADGRPDLAIGSPFYPAGTNDGQLLIVLGSQYEQRTCVMESDCRATEACTGLPLRCTLDAGQNFWRLRYNSVTGAAIDPAAGAGIPDLKGYRMDAGADASALTLGFSIDGLGAFDATAGDDLVVSANNVGNVFFLAGRTYAGTGIQALALAALGAPIASKATNLFGSRVAVLGNIKDGGSATGVRDIAIGESVSDQLFVQLGDPASSGGAPFTAPLVTINGPGTNIGQSIASSYSPVFGDLGDLDLDGRGELLAGTRLSDEVLLWYGDVYATISTGATVAHTTASSTTLDAETDTTAELAVSFVQDFNDDGHPDVVVGDMRANTNAGQVILLY